MAKDYAQKFYMSKRWRKCREAYMQYMHWTCERCGEVAEILHHREYISPRTIEDVEVTLAWDNLEALCRLCHEKEHKEIRGKGIDEEVIAKGVAFNSSGEPIQQARRTVDDILGELTGV